MKIEKQQRLAHEVEHGEKISNKAEEIWGWSTAAGILRAERRANYFISMGKISANSQVLEIGCGTALFTEKVFRATKAHITAIDISPALLEAASAKLPDIDFRVDDAMNLSFPDNTFDCVYGSSILHHLDFGDSLKEIFRVLKPRGRMVFAEPNMLNPQIFIQKNVPIIKKWAGDSPDETAVVRWSFKNIMKKTGFTKCIIFPYDFLHPSVPKSSIAVVEKIGRFFEKVPLFKEIAGSVIIYGEK